MKWLNNIKVLVFDMDGTLYQEDSFLGRYVTYMLQDQYSDQEIKRVIKEAYDILNGEHNMSLGHYFDFTTKSIFTHTELVPNDAFNWAGQKVNNHYSNESRLFYIGDAWCVSAFAWGKVRNQ